MEKLLWAWPRIPIDYGDRKSTRLNSSHDQISYAVFCLKKKKILDKPIQVLHSTHEHNALVPLLHGPPHAHESVILRPRKALDSINTLLTHLLTKHCLHQVSPYA